MRQLWIRFKLWLFADQYAAEAEAKMYRAAYEDLLERYLETKTRNAREI